MSSSAGGNGEFLSSDGGQVCLGGGGEMGERIRAFDWASTPLGPAEGWPPALKTLLRIMLANRFPMILWWGPQFIQFYNDAYRPIPGNKHPRSMGQPACECWSEIWHIIGPLIETPFRGGPATWDDDIFLEIRRQGFVEECHFTIAYSPVPDETAESGIGGVLATVHEITGKVIGDRRVVVLRDLGARSAEARTAEEACAIAANTLASHGKDLPFALLYLIDPDRKLARLAGTAGVAGNHPASPSVLPLDGDDSNGLPWPLAEAMRSEAMQTVAHLGDRLAGQVPPGPWTDPPHTAVVVPIRSNKAHHPAGFLVAGISARLELDGPYRDFLNLVSSQIATAIANAREYEEEKKRAEALAEIDRAKTAFFSNVSHEFRTPLTLMLGPVEELLARSHTGLSPAAKGQLEVAHRNSLRLLRLVNSLLDFSRIEAGRVQAVFEPTDLAAFTAELASVFRAATERAGLKLRVDCPPLPEPVYVDRDMWEKIVLNLVSNAFKFTFEGEIEVKLRVESGEGRVGSGELAGGNDDSEELSRSEGLADSHESGGTMLPCEKELSQGGAIRPDESDSPSCSAGSGEHRGGTGTATHKGVPPSSRHRSWLADGTEDSSHIESARRISESAVIGLTPGGLGRDQSNALGLETFPGAGTLNATPRSSALTTRHSRLATLTVRDTGVGVPAEEMPRLFERFHRVPNMRSRTHEGSGIGLALVQELVKLHGGSVRAESRLGEGTAFLVTVPLGKDHLPPQRIGGSRTRASTSAGAAPFVEEALRWLPEDALAGDREPLPREELLPVPCPAGEMDGARPRLLVADDNADMRQYLARLLAERYHVETVPDGRAALAAARDRRPDLILSDVMMPQLDGLGLMRELRADPGLKTVPVILLSARAGEESRIEGLQQGADDYLVKPFSARELTARVSAHLDMARLRKQSEEALRARENFISGILGSISDAFFSLDKEWRCTFASEELLRRTGKSLPDLLGRNIWEVFPEAVGNAAYIAMQRAMAERVSVEYEVFYEPYQGWYAGKAYPTPDGGLAIFSRDVTERKKAEEELEKERKQLLAIIESLDQAVGVWDADGSLVLINDATAKLYGFEMKEQMLRHLTDYADVQVRTMDGCALPQEEWPPSRVLRGETFSNWELEQYIPSIHKRFIGSNSGRPVRDANGKVILGVTAVRDVTERKKAEAALRESEARFRGYFEMGLIGMAITSPSKGILLVNDCLCDMWGYSREELSRLTWAEITHPDDLAADVAQFNRLLAGEIEGYAIEKRFTRKDGSTVCSHVSVRGIRNADGALDHVVACAVDITARKEAEEMLRLRAALIEAVGQAAIATDAQGRIIYWNAAAERLYGWSRDEAVGRTVLDVTCPGTSREQAEAIMEQLSRGESWRGEFTVQDRSGRVFPAEVIDAPVLDDQGRLAGVIGISSDLTERKRAEAQIFETTQQLQALMQAIPVGVALIDAQGGSIAANPAYEQVWSGPRPPVRSVDDYAAYQAWWAESGEPLKPEDWASARAVQHGEAVVGQLLRIRRFDGSEAIVLNSAAPIRGADGRITGSAVAIQDITAWQESERRLAVAVSGTRVGLWEWNMATGEVMWNSQHARLFGLDTATTGTTPTTVSQPHTYDDWASRVHPEDSPRVEAELRRCLAERAPFEIDYRIVWPDGSLRWMGTRAVFELDGEGAPRRMVGIVMDITERKEAEELVRASLAEKEVLLKEIHHRVKNNMQVICSLVDLQTNTLADPGMREHFREVRDRVRSMALVHEKLYQSETLASIDFVDYTRSLLASLAKAHRNPETLVALELDLQPVSLPIETAVPCGLILNELITNAFKHAFRDRTKGEVAIALRTGPDGRVCLRVCDDGPGLPAGMDWRQSRSLGLRLIHLLAGQLDATVEVRPGGGADFLITFEPSQTKRTEEIKHA